MKCVLPFFFGILTHVEPSGVVFGGIIITISTEISLYLLILFLDHALVLFFFDLYDHREVAMEVTHLRPGSTQAGARMPASQASQIVLNP